MLSALSSNARRVASNVRSTSISGSSRRGMAPVLKPRNLTRRSFATEEQQQRNEEEGSSGIWTKILLAAGLLGVGAGTYTFLSWNKLYPDTPFPLPHPELPASIRDYFPHAPRSSTTLAEANKGEDEDNEHTAPVHTKAEENFLAEPKSAALLLPEVIEEQQHHAHGHHEPQHHHEGEHHQNEKQTTTTVILQEPSTTLDHSQASSPQETQTEAPAITPTTTALEEQVNAVVTQSIADEIASNLTSESAHEAAQHVAQIAEIQPQIEEAAAQAASEVVHLFEGEKTEKDATQEPLTEEATAGETATTTTPDEEALPPKIYTEEECKAILASQREEIMEQTAHFLRGWGEQQATISNLKDKLWEAKEELERVEREYEERIQRLEEQNTHEIDRIRFEATTDKLSAVEKAIKESENLCELKNGKLHEQRVKQIADVYHRVLQLNANLNQTYVSQGEQLRQQICLSLVDILLALQQNKTQLKSELQRLFALSKNRGDILEALKQIPEGFVSGSELVQSREHLKKRFGFVQQVARTQALVPDDGGLWWQLGASLASAFLSPIQPSAVPLEGQNPAETILAKTAYLLEQDDLAAAVTEVEKLSGNARDAVESWINDAKTRVKLESSLHLAIQRVSSTIV